MDSQNNYLNLQEEPFDLKRYFFLFLGNWYWIAFCMFTGIFVSYLVNRYSEQTYSVQTSLLVGDADGRRMSQGMQTFLREMNLNRQTKRIENEIALLSSYSFARKAIDELPEFLVTYVSVGRRGIAESKMYKRSPFSVELDSGFSNRTNYPVNISILNENEYRLEIDDGTGVNQIMKFGEKFTNEHFSFTIWPRWADVYVPSKYQKKFYFIINDPHTLALVYRSKLRIDLNDKNGGILTLSSSGFVAQQEADYLNKITEIYIRTGLEDKALIAENTIQFIDQQLQQIIDSLRRSEIILQNFRAGKGIIDLSLEGKAILDRLELLYSERNQLNLQQEYFKYLENYLKAKRPLKELVSPATIGVVDDNLTETVRQINTLQLEKETLLLSVKPDNFQVIRIDQSLASLTSLLFDKLEGMREINNLRLRELGKRVTEQEANLRLLPVTERELLNMERKYGIHEKFYTYLREKRIEAGIGRASNISDNKVIDRAMTEMARTIKPNRRLNYMIGIFLGLIVPIFIILIFDLLNNSIRDTSQITSKTKVPLVGSIGNNPYETFLPVFHKPKSSFSESFRALRTNLDFLLGSEHRKVVLISSTISGEGKSFIASNLAISLALLGKKTALVGLDLRKPKIQNLFGIDNSKGVSTFLIGRDSLSDITVTTELDSLFVIPAGPIPPNPAELVASKQLASLFDDLKSMYDFVIIDSPPVAIVTDAVIISRISDVTLFVLRHRYTSRNVMGLVDELSQSQTIKNMALILNDFKKPRGYGYGYMYGYGYTYGYGYSYGYGYGRYGEDGEGYYTDEEVNNSLYSKLKKWF